MSELSDVLIRNKIVDQMAIEDADAYDGGLTLQRVEAAEAELGIEELRAEIERLSSRWKARG